MQAIFYIIIDDISNDRLKVFFSLPLGKTKDTTLRRELYYK
jgi:hypothetical protein